MIPRFVVCVFFTLLCCVSATIDSRAQSPNRASAALHQQAFLKAYGRLPLTFVRNEGQTDRQAQFLAQSDHLNLFLTPKEAVFSLTKPMRPRDAGKTQMHEQHASTTQIVRMRLQASNPEPHLIGLGALPGKVSYFLGNDPTKWHPNLPTYAKIRYANVYPGIDLVYYGNQRQLEYDFVLAPHVSPKRIALSFTGTERVQIEGSGELTLVLKDGLLRWHRPVVYQEAHGVHKTIPGRYVLLGAHTVGFEIGKVNTDLPLVIDPQLVYSTYLGGTVADNGTGVALDPQGNAYVTGTTSSPDFPVTRGAFQTREANTYSSAFVTKLSADGSALVYSTYLGGSGHQEAGGFTYGDASSGIAVDAQGSAYITGLTHSIDFPVTKGAAQAKKRGPEGAATAFVSRLSADGASLIYSTYLGGSVYDSANAIAVDSRGNAYVAGGTASIDFPITHGTFQTRPKNTTYTGFVTKLNPTGTLPIYSTFLGGSNQSGGDYASDIAVDAQGAAYIIGTTHSADFPVTQGAFQTTLKGNYNAFVTKLNAAGSSPVYSTFLGGTARDNGFGIAVDAVGDAYVTGSASSIDFPVTRGAFQTQNRGNALNAFITRLNPQGSALVYSTYLGGTDRDRGYAIAVDSQGSAYVTGLAFSVDFPVTSTAFQTLPKNTNGYSAFVTKLSANGSALLYSTYIGGANYFDPRGGDYGDTGAGIAVDAFGNAYVTGQTASVNFPVTKTAFQTKRNSNHGNAFVAKVGTAFPAYFSVVPEVRGAAGETVTLTAQLNDSASKIGVVGADIVFTFSMANVTADLGTVTTDAHGKASLTYTIPEGLRAEKNYAIVVRFYGNSSYNPTAGAGTLGLLRGKTAFTSVPDATGKPGTKVTLTTHLIRASDGKAIANQTVLFHLGSARIGLAQTDGAGLVALTYTLPKPTKLGRYATSATFSGNDSYTGCIVKGILTVTR